MLFRRASALVVAIAATAVLVPAAAAAAAPSPAAPTAPSPTVPSPAGSADAGAAQSAANDAARTVQRVTASVATATRQVAVANRAATLAQRSYDAQVVVQQRAQVAASAALADAHRVQVAYQQAHQRFTDFVTAAYEGGNSSDSYLTLLFSASPSDLLRGADDREFVAGREADVVTQDRQTSIAFQAAQRRAVAALAAARQATLQERASLDAAHAAQRRAGAALLSLRRDLLAARVSQARADAVLSQFLGGWSLADPSRAGALNRRYLEIARKGLGHTPGATAVVRALRRIGTPYAWAGGGAGGPSRGQCVAGDAAHDCQVIGFDCSGLSLYAWAPYRALPHLASAQYTAAGRVHPTPAQLQPGDLVFWSSDGTVAGIHHVAIYVGDGNVVQAPQSGDIVRVTPLGSVDGGYFGATRPLS